MLFVGITRKYKKINIVEIPAITTTLASCLIIKLGKLVICNQFSKFIADAVQWLIPLTPIPNDSGKLNKFAVNKISEQIVIDAICNLDKKEGTGTDGNPNLFVKSCLSLSKPHCFL